MQHFDLCVIGSDSGSSVVTEEFRQARVAIVDGAPGGARPGAGCIPGRMLAGPAEVAEAARQAAALGIDVAGVRVRWADLRARILERVDAAAAQEQPGRRENLTVFGAAGRFVGTNRLRLDDGEEITAERFVIAAGSRPRLPSPPGLDDPQVAARVHTPDDIMGLPTLPRSLVVVGGGAVASEFAHIFAAFGTAVTLLHRGPRLLKAADDEVGERFTDLLSRRVTLRLGHSLASLEATANGVIVGTVDDDGVEYFFEGERVLFALGRVPNADTLDLAATGVDLGPDGRVVVDARQQTTARDIWAFGDVSSPYRLKHVAHHEARVVLHNLLHPDDPVETDHRFVPQAVFSGPQVAWVGATEQQLGSSGRQYVAATQGHGEVAHGWATADTDHLVKILADPTSGQLLGGHVLGPRAGDLLQPLVQAMSFGLDATRFARGQYWIDGALPEVVEKAVLDLPLP